MTRSKTKREIAAEVKALEALKPKVRRFSAFGDDHWESIDAQVFILEHDVDERELDELYPDGDLNAAARETLAWKRGETVHEAPAAGWAELVRR